MVVVWSEAKNELLKAERGVSFEAAAAEIEAGRVLAVLGNPAHAGQRIFVVKLHGYVHFVPFVRDDEGTYYLKTVYPSRKGQKRYGG